MDPNAMPEAAPPLWNYVRIDQHAKPSEPAGKKVRSGLLGVWDRLRSPPKATETYIARKDLGSPTLARLDAVVPTPGRQEITTAVNEALAGAGWPDRGTRVQVFVGSPYSGTQTALKLFAQNRRWRTAAPPPLEEILDGGRRWLQQTTQDLQTPLVIPRLDGCFLRHFDGLTLIRNLLKHLLADRIRCVIGCDSWAWAFLDKTLQIATGLPKPFTLEAFDTPRLQRWFQAPADTQGIGTVFRASDSGEYVLPPLPGNSQAEHRVPDGDNAARVRPALVEVTNFIDYLAAHSRGIPEVARAIWRHSLRCFPEADPPPDPTHESGSPVEENTLWVVPWSQINLPAMPRETNRQHLFLLHALLIHGRLSLDLLCRLLPPAGTAVVQGLHQLAGWGLVEQAEAHWRVSPLAYPAVRRFIDNEGYLLDVL